MATKQSSKRWSRKVTETSNALDLELKVFEIQAGGCNDGRHNYGNRDRGSAALLFG
jgi:Protein of unknown function (DUF3175)